MRKIKISYGLFSVLVLKICLSVYGIGWGLPHRWNQDERITTPLRMLAEKTFFYCPVDFYHPLFYKYFLMAALAPYYLFLKLIGYDFSVVKTASSLSWLSLVKTAPDFAYGLMLVGRISSVILGLGTVIIVYLIAKKIYDHKIGVFSSLALSLNMGFLTTNHFIKNENLSVFLFVCVLYLWTAILADKFSAWRMYLASFLAGLAIGTKLDSAILLMGLGFMILYVLKDRTIILRNRFLLMIVTIFFVLLGALFGYPRVVVPVRLKVGIVEGALTGFSILFSAPTPEGIFLQIKTTVLNIVSSFGIPAFIFVIIGLAFSAANIHKIKKPVKLFYWILIPYLAVEFFLYSGVATKLVIFSFPIFSIFAGYGFRQIWNSLKSHRLFRLFVSLIILIYSIFYAIRADLVFVKNDTRYLSTEWIKNNVRPGSTIGIFQEPELLFSSSLVDYYKIYYQGEELRYDNNPYRETRTATGGGGGEDFWSRGYQYIVASSWDYTKYEHGRDKDRINEGLCDGKGYYLVKKIECREDMFLNPRPAHTSPMIFIFKKHQLNEAKGSDG